MQYGLTEEEQRVLKLPGEFYRAFSALPQLHPADLEEVAFHVHALGRIVAMRAATVRTPISSRTSREPRSE